MNAGIYKFKSTYRGVNKMKGESKYPKYFSFKKGVFVQAEPYNPEKVDGVTFSTNKMMLVQGAYIVPLAFLTEANDEEVKTLGIDLNASGVDATDLASAADENNNLPIVDDFNFAKIKKNGKNIGKGVMFGGIAGFGISYFMKKNLIIGTVIGAAIGVASFIIYDNIQAKKIKETENTGNI